MCFDTSAVHSTVLGLKFVSQERYQMMIIMLWFMNEDKL